MRTLLPHMIILMCTACAHQSAARPQEDGIRGLSPKTKPESQKDIVPPGLLPADRAPDRSQDEVAPLSLDSMHALIVDNAVYNEDAYSNLPGARQDRAMAWDTLVSSGFKPRTLSDATREQFEARLRAQAAEIPEGGTFWLHLSSHGGMLGNELYVLFPGISSSRRGDILRRGVPLSRILNILDSSSAARVVVVLDLCRTPLTGNIRSGDIKVPDNTLLILAARAGESAGEPDGAGFLTSQLYPRLHTPSLTIEQAAFAAADSVWRLSRGDQSPQVLGALPPSTYLRPLDDIPDVEIPLDIMQLIPSIIRRLGGSLDYDSAAIRAWVSGDQRGGASGIGLTLNGTECLTGFPDPDLPTEQLIRGKLEACAYELQGLRVSSERICDEDPRVSRRAALESGTSELLRQQGLPWALPDKDFRADFQTAPDSMEDRWLISSGWCTVAEHPLPGDDRVCHQATCYPRLEALP